MSSNKTISGFSKLSKAGKIKWIVQNFFKEPDKVMQELESYWHSNEEQQKILDNFSENTISNFPMPFGVAPNFLIDGHPYCVPMVIEESSVVAAASAAAKFWMSRGGFKTEIIRWFSAFSEISQSTRLSDVAIKRSVSPKYIQYLPLIFTAIICSPFR